MDSIISKKRQTDPQNQRKYSFDNMLSPLVEQNGKSRQVTVQEELSTSLVTVHSVNFQSHEHQTLHSAHYSTPGNLAVFELEQGHIK